MKIITVLAAILVTGVCHAGETPHMLSMRITQIKQMGTRELKKWPDAEHGLFQGLKKPLKNKVKSREDHLKAISSIPNRLLKDRKIGVTLKIGDWYYTSVEHIDSVDGKPSWVSVIASQRGGEFLYFSYSW